MTLLGGSWVIDGDSFKAALHAGTPWGGFTRKVAIGRDDYPGFDHLLAKALEPMPRPRQPHTRPSVTPRRVS